jgi:hypothetical protein
MHMASWWLTLEWQWKSENRNTKNSAYYQRHGKDEQNEITESNDLLWIFLVCLGVQKSISTIIE